MNDGGFALCVRGQLWLMMKNNESKMPPSPVYGIQFLSSISIHSGFVSIVRCVIFRTTRSDCFVPFHRSAVPPYHRIVVRVKVIFGIIISIGAPAHIRSAPPFFFCFPPVGRLFSIPDFSKRNKMFGVSPVLEKSRYTRETHTTCRQRLCER